MIYRLATRKEAAGVASVLTNAFANYTMYRVALNRFFFNDSSYINYLNKLHYVQAMTNIRKGYCLIAVEGSQIIGVAIMQDLARTRFSLFDYLRSGAFSLWRYVKPTQYFIPFLEKSSQIAKQNTPDGTWFLESLVVAPEWQGKKIGGKFLEEGIIPFIKEKGATQLSLVTNTAMNVHFYSRHQFKQINHTKIDDIDVWTLIRE